MQEAKIIRIADALDRSGVSRVAGAVRPGPKLRIALTHFVDAGRMDDYRRIVDLLLEGHAPVAPAGILGGMRGWPDGGLAFTFDDGLLSSYEAAQQVLNPLGVKAMFFVPTQILGMRSPDEMRDFFASRVYRRGAGTMPEERYVTMSAEHMLELRDQGHSVLPHTHSHIALHEIRSDADVTRELREPKQRLEELTQESCSGFAFPFGTEEAVGRYAYEHVRRTYRVTFTGLHGVNSPRTPLDSLYRDCIHPHFEHDHVRKLMAGALDPVYALKMQRLRRRTR